jgi:hypothetical protein
MKPIFILEAYEGEDYATKIFDSKDSMLKYMDFLMSMEDGAHTLEGYSIIFSELFDINDEFDDIQADESSCVPALSYYRANRECYECDDCD